MAPSSNRDFTGTEALDICHVYIRPRTPYLNGKVERSHRVDDQEFYPAGRPNGIADDIHLFDEKLREWGLLTITTVHTGHPVANHVQTTPGKDGSSTRIRRMA
jgi:hypothetical protein